jgi:iron complex transport system permease protein
VKGDPLPEKNREPLNTENAGGFDAKRKSRYFLVFLFLLAAVFLLAILNINVGNVPLSLKEILRILFLHDISADGYSIIWEIRLPRILMAAMLGGGLSLSGFLLQTFFSNPIAGPFVLGISSGAKMAVAIVMVFFLQGFGGLSSYAMIAASFAGALAATGFILLLSRKIRNMSALLIGGIMIGYICSAVTDFIITFASDSDIVNLHSWSKGSFSGMDWGNVQAAAIVICAAVFLIFLIAKPMDAYLLGEGYAQSMGVNIRAFRIFLILLSSVLSATVTAFAGPISFVGVAVPYLMKRALHTAKPLPVIPASFLGGSVFCMGCDLIARTAFAPTELSITTVTSFFGAPVVIFMLLQKKGGR